MKNILLATLIFASITLSIRAQEDTYITPTYLTTSPLNHSWRALDLSSQEQENTNHNDLPFLQDIAPNISDEVRLEYQTTEIIGRYVDTTTMLIQGGLALGLSIYISSFASNETLDLLHRFFTYGTMSFSINSSMRWANWLFNVNPSKDSPIPAQGDIFNLKKLNLISNVSYLLFYLVPATYDAYHISYSLFTGMLFISGLLTLWTTYTMDSYF